ncbi:hypothetical protein O3M35_009509 [Rhynocoris fuscipes]|uniref:Uncharacterized protein n=1 Tax=Rhynocoris fuscipes TaxID=488301 RepID=A0AAW1D3Z8_9HEMI
MAGSAGVISDTGGRKTPCQTICSWLLGIFCLTVMGILIYRTVILETRLQQLEIKVQQMEQIRLNNNMIQTSETLRVRRDASFPNEAPECVCPPGKGIFLMF